ncbi:MAG: SMP-30/gluconolactonase/LRE family protein, partial [Verrucomicrobiota bacterium]
MIRLTLLLALAPFAAAFAQNTTNFPTLGKIHQHDPALLQLLDADAEIEVLCSGFEWAEGPVWVPDEDSNEGGYVLFSDIPNNRVMKWEEGVGVSIYMEPAGYTGVTDYAPEPGSNGLGIDKDGNLILCEHGDRRLSKLTPNGGKITLVDNLEGKRLNSPNDLAFHSSGAIYFTDPPFGLPKRFEDSRKELDFQGVYRLKDGQLTLLTKELERPNGLAFSPDEKTLYVANSGSDPTFWQAYPVKDDGTLGEGRVFFDPTEGGRPPNVKGGCDGLKVDKDGNLWATGPGGVWIISPEGKALGRIQTF